MTNKELASNLKIVVIFILVVFACDIGIILLGHFMHTLTLPDAPVCELADTLKGKCRG